VLSLHGRSTRGSLVYDVVTGAVCCLKDTWRISSDEQLVEGKTYGRLRKAKVNHIANVVAHDDVLTSIGVPHSAATNDQPTTKHQTTFADLFCQSNDEWCTLRPRLQGYIHYRIVLDMVGREYTSFKSTKELLLVTVDAIRGVSLVVILFGDLLTAGVFTEKHMRRPGYIASRHKSWEHHGGGPRISDRRDLAKSIHGEGAHLPGRTVSATKFCFSPFPLTFGDRALGTLFPDYCSCIRRQRFIRTPTILNRSCTC
jgi:hypothetical protein